MTIYFLNIVAWGAMLFFLELKAAPAMNHPSADANSSPRKIWLEIDSQILNALFCVTAFGLAPWRFRDLYHAAQYRFCNNHAALKKLAALNSGWFRLPQAVRDDEEAKFTSSGLVAPPTRIWKLEFVVSMMAMNTFLQCVLCGFMWGYNRFDRPSWATGTFIGLGCATAAFAGVMCWWEGRKVKRIEGPVIKVMVDEED
jgi:hypothetical protein